MNEIFGVVRLGRSPLQGPEIERLALPTSHGVQEIPSTWISENIALGFAGFSSHLTEAPVLHGPTGVRVYSVSRLDNRGELCQKLRVPVELQCEYSDGKLILDAFLKYGESCVEHLLGDWVFAAWDPREHKFVLARDHTGMLPVHYHASPRELYFSTSIRRLLGLDCVANRPNLLRVGQMLSTWPADGVLTYYEAVKKLPAAHILVCKDGASTIRQYWALGLELRSRIQLSIRGLSSSFWLLRSRCFERTGWIGDSCVCQCGVCFQRK